MKNSGIVTATKVFMVLGCIVEAIAIVPLFWTIPMTIHYCNAKKNGNTVGIGFKICALLFVSLIGGILMLCDND